MLHKFTTIFALNRPDLSQDTSLPFSFFRQIVAACPNCQERSSLFKGTRWVILKNAESSLTADQAKALEELNRTGTFTYAAWKVKKKLRWVRKTTSLRSAKW
ncbi:MAG: transposase [Deltaproteobacteria bacterium]|nr:transposase [Deltaproteobacteria bacterium]